MLEAKLKEAATLKRLLEGLFFIFFSVKEHVF